MNGSGAGRADAGSAGQCVPVVAARGDDAGGVVALWHACGLTRPWNDPAADFAMAVAGATSAVLLHHDAAGLAASVMVGFDGHRGWVYYLAVAPRARGCGLGAGMMAAAEAWLVARGAPKIQFMVRDDNRDVIAFYARLGYETQPVVTIGRRLDGAQPPPGTRPGDGKGHDHR
ncbi:MAG: GNAT family acetyltransferase [Sphingopyxis sp.]